MKIFWILITIIVAAVIIWFFWGITFSSQYDPKRPRACTEEAKVCPDGSAVGRTGPNCEFAPCPDTDTSTADTDTTEQGIVKGQVTLSPTCPVERNPPDPKCAPNGFETNIQAFKPGTSSEVANTKSDSAGNYQLSLPPGIYDIFANKGGMMLTCQAQTVTIKTSTTAILDFDCDSGIR